MRIGYFLSCEEYTPAELIEQAKAADARLRGALDQRPLPSVERRAGQQPVRLERHRGDQPGLRPPGDHRRHLSDRPDAPGDHRAGSGHERRDAGGRFVLGVGSGEALDEHILGDVWPSADVRLQMLEEAVALLVGPVLLGQVPGLLGVLGIGFVVVAGVGAQRTGGREQLDPVIVVP